MEDSISIGFVDNLILFRAMKKFWKSVKIWQSYGHEYVAYFFWATLYIDSTSDYIWQHSGPSSELNWIGDVPLRNYTLAASTSEWC